MADLGGCCWLGLTTSPSFTTGFRSNCEVRDSFVGIDRLVAAIRRLRTSKPAYRFVIASEITLTVELVDENSGKEITYRIVGEDEADIKNGLISYTSPIARALISKNEGDVIEFQAPDGEKTYEVIEVRYE